MKRPKEHFRLVMLDPADQAKKILSHRRSPKEKNIFETICVTQPSQVFSLFAGENVPDALILFPVSKEQGLKFLKLFQTEYPSLTILLASPWESMEYSVEAMQQGAHDVFKRDEVFTPQNVKRIRKQIERQRIQHDLKKIVRTAFHQAARDPLTGLANRSLLQERFQAMIAETKRHGGLLGILFVDLDNFKTLNDRKGHALGDLLLKETAERLSKAVRQEDVIARIGGDEFVALLGHVEGMMDIERVAARLLAALQEQCVFSRKKFSLAASIGISIFPFDGTTQEELLEKADAAMYRAKEGGGNCYHYYNKELKEVSMNKQKRKKQHTKTILIVDDEKDFQLLLEKRLTSAGYVCRKCTSVEEALKELPVIEPDLVILDLGFQRASGIAFLQGMSNYLKRGDTVPPVLVMSGHSNPEIQEFVSNLGASGFIEKPFKSERVLSTIKSLIH